MKRAICLLSARPSCTYDALCATSPVTPKTMNKKTKFFLAAIAILLVVIVVMQNTGTIETKLLFVSISMPRAVLLVVHLLIGFLLGLFAGGRLKRRSS